MGRAGWLVHPWWGADVGWIGESYVYQVAGMRGGGQPQSRLPR